MPGEVNGLELLGQSGMLDRANEVSQFSRDGGFTSWSDVKAPDDEDARTEKK